MAGYSGTPLLGKLGYRAGQRALLVGVPDALADALWFDGFAALLRLADVEALPADGAFDLIHVFGRERAALARNLPRLAARLEPAGMLWVSWPKKASGVPSSLSEDVIRAMALEAGLVDVKVCAVDAVWSGLKLVVPLSRRG
jgi:hypothetical protein